MDRLVWKWKVRRRQGNGEEIAEEHYMEEIVKENLRSNSSVPTAQEGRCCFNRQICDEELER